MKLDASQGRELGKALFDVGKVAFGIAVATPLVTAGGGGWRSAWWGVLFVLTLFTIATQLVTEGR